MNIQLKQRLVGAAVLVSLAVIVIPMLLPGEGDRATTQRGSLIPEAPDYRFAPVPESPVAPHLAAAPPVPVETPPVVETPQKLPEKADIKPSVKASVKTAAKPASSPDLPIDAATPKESPVSKKGDSQATAWVVQVGSFSRSNNAHALRDKLRKQGFASFVEAVKDAAGKPVYRVRVGPEVRRDLADKLQQLLVRDAKLTGIVLRYP